MTDVAADVTEDLFLGGRLKLRQPKRGHRAGHDAMLLAAATPARPGDRVVDFGAGVGAAGLAVARRVTGIDLAMVEIDDSLAALAHANAHLNEIAAQVAVLDLTMGADAFAEAGLGADTADVVLMNPPFNDAGRHRSSPDVARRSAHMAAPDTLARWIHAARRVLKPGGALVLIWRADGLAEVLGALERGFGTVEVLPVHSAPAAPAIRILVRATQGGRAPLSLHPGLVLQDATGKPSPDAEAVLGGTASLSLARV